VSPRLLRWLLNLYPPFLGAGVRVASIAADWSQMVVELKLRWYNRNYVGTHFGGNLFTMTDPFHMLMLIQRLGPEYIVWDQAAEIRFLKPGRGRVRGVLSVSDARVEEIRQAAQDGAKHHPEFVIEIIDEQGAIVAQVNKTLYVRLKSA
jgi:acyl-coenzyme A thioesterase PaaI-like protein